MYLILHRLLLSITVEYGLLILSALVKSRCSLNLHGALNIYFLSLWLVAYPTPIKFLVFVNLKKKKKIVVFLFHGKNLIK